MAEPRIQTLADIFLPEFSKLTAVIVPDTGPTWTYRELSEQVQYLVQALQKEGIRPNDVAILVLSNGVEFIAMFLALVSLGAIALPVNPACTADEIGFAIEDSNAALVVAHSQQENAAAAAKRSLVRFAEISLEQELTVRVDFSSPDSACSKQSSNRPDDIALILYTSGTTNRPKSVPITHRNIAASIHNFASWFNLTPNDNAVVVMPPFHVHGLIGVTLATLYSGGTAIVPPRFSASTFWEDVIDYGATWYSGSPSIHQILLKRADEDQAPSGLLRFIRSSSAKLPPAVRKQVENRFETVMIEAYGMTEASNQVSANPLPPLERKFGSVGLPAGSKVMILDDKNARSPAGQVGQVCISGPNVTAGYLNAPESNSQVFFDGWFKTGDLGYLDNEGYLFVTGRIKDLINRGGEKISPLEIENILLEHPAVAEAVCFAAPHEIYGEEVHAAIVAKNEADTDEILSFCRQHLAEYKVPKVLHIVGELPRNALNKIQRNLVAAMFNK